MKKHSLVIESITFFTIFFLFIVSSFISAFNSFNSSSFTTTVFESWSFPWQLLIMSLFCIALLLIFYEKSNKRTLLLFPVIMTFGLLFCVSLFCKAVAAFTGDAGTESSLTVAKPHGCLQWIFCLLTFIFAAFNEEVIYRFYLADKMYQLLSVKLNWKFLRLLCELFALLCFAFAHLYLGWISVLNAGLAHIILRLCYRKNEKLWPCVLSHFLYNVISLILL